MIFRFSNLIEIFLLLYQFYYLNIIKNKSLEKQNQRIFSFYYEFFLIYLKNYLFYCRIITASTALLFILTKFVKVLLSFDYSALTTKEVAHNKTRAKMAEVFIFFFIYKYYCFLKNFNKKKIFLFYYEPTLLTLFLIKKSPVFLNPLNKK